MKIIKSIKEMQDLTKSLKKENKKIALVPTMGYFHSGHTSLMSYARDLADIVITSLFVNPTQFAPNEDFDKYPRDFERDSKIAEENKTNFLFYPSVNEMYPTGFKTMINMQGITDKFEGEKRPAHFNGVSTIVAKLFNACLPDIAIFGQKDYQQTAVIRKLVRDLNFPIRIVIAPTKREDDGLAMSSRNVYLSQDHRKQAPILYQAMEEARQAIENGERRRKVINAYLHKKLRTAQDIRIDYASSANAETFEEPETFSDGQHIVLLLACYLGKTRLIDNSLISLPGANQSFNKSYIDMLPEIG